MKNALSIQSIVLLLISLYFIYRLILKPVVNLINPLSLINKLKKIDLLMGEKIIGFRYKELIGNWFYITSIIAICVFTVLGIIFKMYFIFVLVLVLVNICFSIFTSNKCLRSSGVYNNGIVVDEFYYWDKIHSWKINENSHVSLLLNSGIRIDLDNTIDKEKLINIFIGKNVLEDK